jgi:hypothetical protein
MATVACPSCERALEVEDEYRDWKVRCPHCAATFVPSEVAPAGTPTDDGERPRRRARDDDYDDRDEDDDRPRRRRLRDDDEDDEDDRYYRRRPDPAVLVHGPGLALEICGWCSLVMAGLTFVILVLMAVAVMNNPPPNRNGADDPPEVFLAIGLVSGALGVPYSLVLVVGGRKMRSLSSRGWAMAAAVVATTSFIMVCLVGVCAGVVGGFGIWALTTLNNPAVQRAFERPPNRYRRDRDD